MKKRLATWATVLLMLSSLIALFTVPAAAASSSSLTVKTMKISLWPEYDDPRVLVIYQGEFNDGTAFPADVGFPVPNGVEINQVCALQPPDTHLCQLYTTASNGPAMDIDYNLPIPTYYLEYYWNGIDAGASGNKSIAFSYTSPYEIDSLTVEVQQPARSTGFTPEPSGAAMVTDSNGMNDYEYTFTNVQPGQVITIGADYTKTDNNPSFTKGQTSGAATAGGSGGGTSYGWVFALAGAAVLVTGFFVFRRRPVAATRAQSRRMARAEARRAVSSHPQPAQVHNASRQTAASRTAVPSRQSSGSLAFCPYCGTKLASGAAFCHGCGAEMNGLGQAR